MWAVGRLSLLSSGLEAAARAKAVPVKPMAVASVAAVPNERAAIPIPIPAPIPEPIRMPTNDTVPIAPPPSPPPRLETVPFPAEAQSATPARAVLKPEPIAQEPDHRADHVPPEPPKTPEAAPIPVPVPVAATVPAPTPAPEPATPGPVPVPVSAAPEATVETPSLLRRIVTRVTRFFRSLFG